MQHGQSENNCKIKKQFYNCFFVLFEYFRKEIPMVNKRPLAVAGQGLSEKCRTRLTDLGFEVVILPPYSRLGRGVDTHADLMLFPLDGKIFIYRELIDLLPTLISELTQRGYEIMAVDTPPSEKYPSDIGLNCLKIGKNIFCRKKNVAREVLEYAESNGYNVKNTNQGYARCTAAPLSDKGIISADVSMLKVASECGLAALSVSVGTVALDGFEYGFIGGACGAYGDSLYFSGDIYSHPDGKDVVDFCHRHSTSVVSLSDEPLSDVGSLFFFDSINF